MSLLATFLLAAMTFPGKVKTDRSIVLEVVVDAPVEEVYRLWSTRDGVRSFFASDAIVGNKPGDEYAIMFDAARDPEGRVTGTRGSHLLLLDPPRRIAFEWIPFIAADRAVNNDRPDAPPYAPPAIRNETPLPTWVEIELDPVSKTSTRVRLSHHGFKTGPHWDRAFPYFRDRAWPMVLDQLKTYASSVQQTATETLVPPEFDRYTIVFLMRGEKAGEFSEDRLEELQNQHLAYLKRLYAAGDLMAMGPFLVADDDPMRGIMVFRGDIPAERVRELASSDPSVAAGRLSFRIVPWMTPKGALAPGSRTLW